MSGLLQQLKERAKAKHVTLVFPESHDERVIQACLQAKKEGLFHSILIGPEAHNGLEYRQAENDPKLPFYAEAYRHLLKRKLEAEDAIQELLETPNLYGAVLIKTGQAYGGVSGSSCSTASVIRAGMRGLGLKSGLISSSFLMIKGDTLWGYGDCGVVPVPTMEQLAEIAISTAETYQRLTQKDPYVALLSFSTLGSADHSCLDPIRGAVKLIRQKAPDLPVDGELQFDAAFLPAIAQRKCPSSTVAGKANVFIFPDLNAGNIAYKITERLGGFTALGPLLQGLKAPWMDLSRGCSPEDILYVGVIASLLERDADLPSN